MFMHQEVTPKERQEFFSRIESMHSITASTRPQITCPGDQARIEVFLRLQPTFWTQLRRQEIINEVR